MKYKGSGFAWLGTGTRGSPLDAALLVKTPLQRRGLKVTCIEEISDDLDYSDRDQLVWLAEPLRESGHAEHLVKVPAEG